MAKQLNRQVNLNINADTKQAQRELNNLFKSLDDIASGKTFSLGNMTKEMTEASQAAAALKGHLQSAMNTDTGRIDFSKLDRSLKNSGTSLQKYADTLISIGPAGQQAFNSLMQNLSKAEIPLRKSNTLVNELWTTLKNTAKWQISSSILHAFMGALQTAKGYAQDLNESLTNIRIVTGYSTDKMAEFAEQANKAARALSTTTTEYTNASLIFYQQGLSAEEVQKRTDVTIKMANAANQSVEETSNQLTAIWNNFDDGTKSLEYYADVITALGAATATSAREISGGLEKFAAIGETIGLSYEYATAALATITSKTRQSEDVVGTALKTIFARIQGLNLGETAEDGTTLNKYSQALAKVGISIYDTTGELKAMDNILDEMAAKWDTLGSAQQAALAQTVAGVRQYNQLISLMEGWNDGASDSMVANLKTARNASGALQEQADIYAEGWEAARDRVKAASEAIYSSLLNDEFFIGVLKNTEKILGFVDNLIDGFGGLGGVLTTVGALLTKVFNKQITKSLQDMSYSVKMMLPGAQRRAEAQKAKDLGEAADWISPANMSAGEQETKAHEDSVRRQIDLQSELNIKAKDLNETQKLILQNRIDNYNILSKEVEAQAQLADKAKLEQSNVLLNMRLAIKENSKKENYNNNIQSFNEIREKNAGIFNKIFAIEGTKDINEVKNLLNELKGQNFDIELNLEDDLQTVEQALATLEKIKDLASKNYEKKLKKLFDENKGQFTNLPATEEEIHNFVNAERNVIETNAQLQKSNEVLDDNYHKLKNGIGDAQKQSKDWAGAITNTTNIAFGLASAIQNIVGVIDIWNNQEMSAGQRFLSILTSATMVAPQLISSISSITKAFGDWASAAGKTAKAVATGAQATVDGIDAIPKDKIDAIVLIIGAIIAAIAGIAIAISSAKKKSEKELKEFKQRLDDLKTSNEELKNSIQGLEDTYATYTELKEKIDGCVKGTDEWTEAVTELKATMSTLAAEYPDLEFEWGENGLEITNLEQVLESEKKRLSNLQLGTYLTENLEKQKILEDAQENYEQYIRFDRSSFTRAEGSTAASSITAVLLQFQDTLAEASKISNKELEKTLDYILKTQATFTLGESNSPVSLEQKFQVEGISEEEYQKELSELAKGLVGHLKAINSANEEEATIRERNNKLIAELLGSENFSSTVLALTASEVENVVKTVKDGSNYSTFNKHTTKDEAKDLWDEYNRIQGTDYELKENAVRGKDGKVRFVYKGENGKQTITLDEVLNVVLSDDITAALEEKAIGLAKVFEEASIAGQDFALKIAEGKFTDKDGNTSFDLTDWVENLGQTEYDALPKTIPELTSAAFEDYYKTYLEPKYNLSYDKFIQALTQQGWELTEVLGGIIVGLQNVDDSFTESDKKLLGNKGVTGSAAEKRAYLNTNSELHKEFYTAYGHLAGQGLTMALGDIGITDAATLENLYSDILSLGNLGGFEAIEKFKELAKTYNLSEDAIDGFVNQMEKLPRLYNLSTKAAEEQVAAIKKLIGEGKLEVGDIISAEAYSELSSFGIDIENYFAKMADGSYRLANNAEEFNKIVEENALEGLEQQLKKIDTILGDYKIEDLTGEDAFQALKSVEGIDFSSIDGAEALLEYDSFQDALQAGVGSQETLEAMISLLFKARDVLKEQINTGLFGFTFEEETFESLDHLNFYIKTTKADAEQAAAMLVDLGKEYDNCAEEVRAFTDVFERYNEELAKSSEIDNAATLGVLEEEVKAKKEALESSIYLAEEAKLYDLNSDTLENYSKRLKDYYTEERVSWKNASRAAADLAIANARLSKGIETLSSSMENWLETLKASDKNSFEYIETLGEIKSALADVYDIVDGDMLSDSFIEKLAKDGESLQKIAKGDLEAINKLRLEVGNDLALNFIVQNIDDADLQSKAQLAWTKFQHQIDELPSVDFEVGAHIEGNSEFVRSLNDYIKQAKLTKDQVNSLLGSMGMSAELEIGGEYANTYIPQYRVIEELDGDSDDEIGRRSYTTRTIPLEPVKMPAWVETASIKTTAADGTSSGGGIDLIGNNNYKPSAPKVSSGGGGGSSKPAKKPKKSDTIERYKEVNDKLDNVSENLTKIDETTERIYGKSRLTNMTKANELLAKEVELNKEKLEEAKDYLKVDQEALKAAASAAGISFQFNAAGDISNYTQEMTKLFNEYDNLVNAVNADNNVSDAEQEKLDKIQERIDAVKDALSQYDETKELIADLEKDIIDGANKIQDQNFKILEEGLSLEVDFNEEQLKLIDHYIKLIEDDIYKLSEAAALSASKYAEYEQNLGSAEEMLSGLTAAYENGNISQSDYVEGLQLFRDTAYENIESIVELKKQMEEYYGNTLDKAIEKLSKYTNQMEQSNSVLEHYYNILTLTNAIPNYGAMDTLLKSQKETAKMQLTAARETAAMLKGQAEERRAAWEAATGLEKEALYEQYQKALEASNTAQEEYLNLAEQYAESIKSVYENAMSELAANLEDVLTGGTSMDQLATAMDRMVSLQEEYLTTTNKIYETNKLMRVAQQAIDKSSNSITKNRLKNFINETQALQDQSQLSEYELEIQKAKYDLLLAEIALQDAQNAKSIVRLQRDSEGNFGYVYTADAEAVGSAADDVAAAQNDLYNIGLRGANDYTQKYQQTMQEMYDSVTELNQQYLDGAFGSYEEFQEQVEATTQYYYDKLKQYQSLYGVAIEVDSRVSADAWGANFETMTNNTEDWYKAVKDYTTEATSALSGYTEEMQELSNEVGLSTKEIAEKTQETAENNKELLNVLTGENGLIKAFDDEATAVANITDAFLTQANAIEDLIVKYDDLIERTLTLQGIEKDQDLKIEETKTQENTSEPVVKNAEATAAASSNATTWERGLEAFNKINRGAWGSGLSNRIQKGVADGFTEAEVRLGQSIIEKYYSGYTDFDKIKALLGFESGGYTGNWAGSSGRLALLHKKELVLNKDDTQNFLSSISLLDKILSAIDLYSANAQFTGGLRAASAASHNQSLEQHITIEASFPAVQSHFEIEEAFNNLAIQASQYANQK